jgi:CDP-diacylglycerol---glycerol-3-phosphate 3-phosphatidyltransferase
MPPSRLNLANGITLARIAACPAIFVLALSPHPGHLFAAFLLFLAAALSDLWDGYLARKHGWVTNMGMLLDPLADKLLLVSTFVPFYLVSQRPDPLTDIPWWGPLPLWVVLVIFGREALVTVLRSWAAQRGSVIGAGRSGKVKAFVQNVFSGSLLLWYALARTAAERGWTGTAPWEAWGVFHGAVTGSTLLGALVLTVYSMVVYLWQNRALMTGAPS